MIIEIDSILLEIRKLHAQKDGFLPLHAPVFAGNEKAYVTDTIDSTFVSSVGAYVTRFEDMLAEITGARHAVACANGTAALQVALHLCGVKPGDLVVTQSLSFVATANAIAHTGAMPVFCDVDAETLGLSPEAVRTFLHTQCETTQGQIRHRETGRRVAACVPMHTFGFPCRIDELVDVCNEWCLPLVEDAAEALGSTHGGRHCGTFGKVGTLSFNGNKIVTTGGGGALLTNDPEIGRYAKHLTTTAKVPHTWEFRHDAVAWNYRMPNLNAALGCAQLERLDVFLQSKRELANAYEELFAGTSYRFLSEQPGVYANYWLCAVLCADRAARDAFLAQSNAAGVMTRPCWEPLHTLPMFQGCTHDDLSSTMRIVDCLINIPSSARMENCNE